MVCKFVKIIGSELQGEVKIGFSQCKQGPLAHLYKNMPKSFLKYCLLPPSSAKHVFMISQGQFDKVEEVKGSYGYIPFVKVHASELGILDAVYRDQKMKCATLMFDPKKHGLSDIENAPKAKVRKALQEFVDCLNWLHDLMKEKRGSIFERDTAIYLINRMGLPTKKTTPFTVEDFADAGEIEG